MTITSVIPPLESSSEMGSAVTMADVWVMEGKLEKTRELLSEQEEQYEQMQKDVLKALNGPTTSNKKMLKATVALAEVLLSLSTIAILGKVLFEVATMFPSDGPKHEALLAFLAFAVGAVVLLKLTEQISVRVISPFRVRRGIGTLEDFERASNKS